LTAASTSVFARESRAADTQREDYPTVQALRYLGRQLGEEGKTIEQTRVGTIDLDRTNVVQRDPASAALIERIRKAE
jgi:hypothetical protein